MRKWRHLKNIHKDFWKKNELFTFFHSKFPIVKIKNIIFFRKKRTFSNISYGWWHQKKTKQCEKNVKKHEKSTFFTKLIWVENAKNDHFSNIHIGMECEMWREHTIEKSEKRSKNTKKRTFLEVCEYKMDRKIEEFKKSTFQKMC